MTPIRIAIVVGTRPEVIKLAPVVRALRQHQGFEAIVVSTGQHREMLRQALDAFALEPDVDLDVMATDQSLSPLASAMLAGLDRVWRERTPSVVVVQGDTASTFVGALSAYYARIPIAHVEAGLRTGDLRAPFPEEAHRRMADAIADWCFAPTEESRRNLQREGVDDRRIHVTGNTGIDALCWMKDDIQRDAPDTVSAAPLMLVTAHRRESFDGGLQRICDAIEAIVDRRPGLSVMIPVHLNPNVRAIVRRRLGQVPNITLAEPLDYRPFVAAMLRARVIVTDSGGVQEEAVALGRPVVVVRDVTDRPEGVQTGAAVLAGTDANRIVELVLERLDADPAPLPPPNPYGDGRAAERIVGILSDALHRR